MLPDRERTKEQLISVVAVLRQQLGELKIIEIERKRAEEKYRAIFDKARDGIVLIDYQTGNIVDCNREFERLSGRNIEQLSKMKLWEVRPPKKMEAAKEKFFEIKEKGTGSSAELELQRPDGEVVPVEFVAQRIMFGGKYYIQSIARDITERKRVEHKISKHKQDLQTIIDSSRASIWYKDTENRILRVNRAADETMNLSVNELEGKTAYELFPEHADKYYQDDLRVFNSGRPELGIVEEMVLPSGERRWVSTDKILYKDEKDNIAGLIAFVTDITERKQAEEALRESEERYRSIVEQSPEAIVVHINGEIVYANSLLVKLVGQKNSENVIGSKITDFVHPSQRSQVLDLLQNIQEGVKIVDSFEQTITKPDGNKLYLEWSSSPVRWGGQEGRQVIIRDITDRKRAEHDLKERVKELQCLYGITNVAGRPGITLDELYQEVTNLLTPGWQYPEITCARIIINDKEFQSKNYRETEWRQSSNIKVRGERTGVVEVCYLEERPELDEGPFLKEERLLIGAVAERIGKTTERKQAEEALRLQSEIAVNMTEGVYLVRASDGVITYTNPKFEKMFGYELGEMIGKHVSIVNAPNEKIPRETAKEIMEFMAKTGAWEGEIQNTKKDGTPFWCYANVSYFDHPEHGKVLVAVHTDITERKQAEEEVRESEAKYRSLVRNVKLGVFRSTPGPAGKFLEVNPAIKEITGYSRKELLQMNVSDLYVHPGKREAILGEIASGRGKATKELAFRKKDGTEIVVSATVVAVRDDAGEVIYFDGIIEDITERKQAEEALRESEDRFRIASQIASDVVYERELQTGIATFYGDIDSHLGYEPGGYPRTMEGWREHVHPEDLAWFDTQSMDQLEPGVPYTVEYRMRKKDGTYMTWLDQIMIIWDEKAGRPLKFIGAATNITERKQAEEREKQLQEELARSSRLASIGELAAGVAHELNNPLTGILGFSERLLRKSTDEKFSRGLETIRNEALRAAEVVQNLLTFARRREPKKEYSGVNSIVHKALELRTYELKTGNIEVVTDLAPGLPEIVVDAHQIQEVFLNIILNAEQAMTEAHGRGRLTIKTQKKTKGYIRVAFVDDGPGVPAKQLDKLFDPFFTTRGEKGGTGLGLSVCHGIVTEHGGKIYAKSKPGKGATFIVELPCS